MPFNDSLSRFNTCCIASYTSSDYTQLFMSMWKLRKRLFTLFCFIIFYIFPIYPGHDKYGRTLIQVCSALPDKWAVIDWLLKQKKVDINPKNLESGYTVNIFFGIDLDKFCYIFILRLYIIVYSMEESKILLILLKYFTYFFKSNCTSFSLKGRCKYKSIGL